MSYTPDTNLKNIFGVGCTVSDPGKKVAIMKWYSLQKSKISPKSFVRLAPGAFTISLSQLLHILTRSKLQCLSISYFHPIFMGNTTLRVG
jgi:hypothetical protein